jgi:hypothetical protein
MVGTVSALRGGACLCFCCWLVRVLALAPDTLVPDTLVPDTLDIFVRFTVRYGELFFFAVFEMIVDPDCSELIAADWMRDID